MENFTMVAKTFFGFEEILAQELQKLGATHIEKGVRSVQFKGDKGFMYKANLALRTALKILKPIGKFKVRNQQDYYSKLYNFPWENFIGHKNTFSVEATLSTDLFNHSKYMALRAKDAIVDKIRNVSGLRPNVDTLHPDLAILIHLQKDAKSGITHAIVSIDTSGESLHHRGYRTATNIAPINEVLAAGILLLSGWNDSTYFFDPMCGSGTLLIEAAMIACNIPANLHRKEFAFERWKDYDNQLFETIYDSSLSKVKEYPLHLYGYDKAPSAIQKAKENIRNANLQEYITLTQTDFFKSPPPTSSNMHICFNPPYGERLNIEMENFYSQLGNTLKQHYANDNHAWFITSNIEAIKHVGLRPSNKIKLFNGKLESRLLHYALYKGTKKLHKIKE